MPLMFCVFSSAVILSHTANHYSYRYLSGIRCQVMQRMRCVSCVNTAELECNITTSTDAVLVLEGDVIMRQTHVSVVLALAYRIYWYMRIKCWRFKKKTTLLCSLLSLTQSPTQICVDESNPFFPCLTARRSQIWTLVVPGPFGTGKDACSPWACVVLQAFFPPLKTCVLWLIRASKSSFL